MDLSNLLLQVPRWVFAFAAVALVLVCSWAIFIADCRVELFGLGFGRDRSAACEGHVSEPTPRTVFKGDPEAIAKWGRLIPVAEGLCFLSHLEGDLRGGEEARVFVNGGYWELEKRGKQHVRATATCLRYAQ